MELLEKAERVLREVDPKNAPFIVGMYYVGPTCNGSKYPGGQRFKLVGGKIVHEAELYQHLMAFKEEEERIVQMSLGTKRGERPVAVLSVQPRKGRAVGHVPLPRGTILTAPEFEKTDRGSFAGPKCLVLEVVFTEEVLAAKDAGRPPIVRTIVVRGGNNLKPSEVTYCKYTMRQWMCRSGYSITTHSAQGAEAGLVFFVLNRSVYGCSRLMNVAITRAMNRGCVVFFATDRPMDADIDRQSTLHTFIEKGFSQRDEVLVHCLLSGLRHVLVLPPPLRASQSAKEAFTAFPPYCEFERRGKEKLPREIPPVFDGMTERERQAKVDEEAARAAEKRRRLQPKKRERVQPEPLQVVVPATNETTGTEEEGPAGCGGGGGHVKDEDEDEDALLWSYLEAFEGSKRESQTGVGTGSGSGAPGPYVPHGGAVGGFQEGAFTDLVSFQSPGEDGDEDTLFGPMEPTGLGCKRRRV
jgi:hypothetical protein